MFFLGSCILAERAAFELKLKSFFLPAHIFELDLTIPKKFAWGIAKCVEHLFATTVAMQLQDSHDATSKYGWHADASAGVVEKD